MNGISHIIFGYYYFLAETFRCLSFRQFENLYRDTRILSLANRLQLYAAVCNMMDSTSIAEAIIEISIDDERRDGDGSKKKEAVQL